MKERPIIFSAQMVRAIQSGIKTQTRQAVKPVGLTHVEYNDDLGWHVWWDVATSGIADGQVHQEYAPLRCPYGVPGDRLWVKERWQHSTDARGTCVVRYEADDGALFALAEHGGEGDFCGVGGKADPGRCMPVESWRSAASMKRWASRITLEVTEVRVQRLQEISEKDAAAEGLVCWKSAVFGVPHWGLRNADAWERTAKAAYARLWESINGAGSWAANPWVWVMGFKQAEVPGAR